MSIQFDTDAHAALDYPERCQLWIKPLVQLGWARFTPHAACLVLGYGHTIAITEDGQTPAQWRATCSEVVYENPGVGINYGSQGFDTFAGALDYCRQYAQNNDLSLEAFGVSVSREEQ